MSLPPPPERDWDAEFNDIVGRIQLEAGSNDLPASRRVVGQPPTFDAGSQQAEPAHETESNEAVPGFRSQWRVPDVIADEDENEDADDFVPPDPEPLDSDDPATIVMIAALVVGPLWLLYLLFFDRYAAWLWWSLAALVTVTGFVLAIARQPQSRDEEDPDEGARV